jgi:hypothetical protein
MTAGGGGLRQLCLLSAALCCFGCGSGVPDPPQPTTWTTGFWFWNGSSTSVTSQVNPIDVIFFQAGSIIRYTFLGRPTRWTVSSHLPEHLPPAREYWLVFRMQSPGVPDPEVAGQLARVVTEMKRQGPVPKLRMSGIQLDVDSPTSALPLYAAFLRELRKSLGPDVAISITALLDWFRSGTAVGDVLREVDEFVPQFYDLETERAYRGNMAIAARIDAAKWGPIFNRHKKRFRIGISTFGRARLVPHPGSQQYGGYFRELKPLDVAVHPDLQFSTYQTEAKERVLSYQAARQTTARYQWFNPGDTFEFIFPTPEAIQFAVSQARLMRGYCAGVLFFRWPAFDESLATPPDDVFAAAGILPAAPDKFGSLQAIDGSCAAVHCTDLYLVNASPLSETPMQYRIDSSIELEYFLPNEGMPVRMVDASRIELKLPPFCGRSRMYLGRAVTATKASYSVGEKK